MSRSSVTAARADPSVLPTSYWIPCYEARLIRDHDCSQQAIVRDRACQALPTNEGLACLAESQAQFNQCIADSSAAYWADVNAALARYLADLKAELSRQAAAMESALSGAGAAVARWVPLILLAVGKGAEKFCGVRAKSLSRQAFSAEKAGNLGWATELQSASLAWEVASGYVATVNELLVVAAAGIVAATGGDAQPPPPGAQRHPTGPTPERRAGALVADAAGTQATETLRRELWTAATAAVYLLHGWVAGAAANEQLQACAARDVDTILEDYTAATGAASVVRHELENAADMLARFITAAKAANTQWKLLLPELRQSKPTSNEEAVECAQEAWQRVGGHLPPALTADEREQVESGIESLLTRAPERLTVPQQLFPAKLITTAMRLHAEARASAAAAANVLPPHL
jgi:hypothetical protein